MYVGELALLSVIRIQAASPPWCECPGEHYTSNVLLSVTVPLAQSPAVAELYSSYACRECQRYVLSDLFLSGKNKNHFFHCQLLIGT